MDDNLKAKIMRNVSVQPTDYTPRFEFNLNGRLLIEGRSLPENVNKLFDPVMHFSRKISISEIVLDINLEYFNTATSKKMLELLQTLEFNTRIGKVTVNWHYEEDDEDSREIAEIYSECLPRTDMRYIAHAELVVLFKPEFQKSSMGNI